MDKNKEKGMITKIYDWFKNLTIKGLLSLILLAFIIIIILLSLSLAPQVFSRISSSLTAALYSVFVPAKETEMPAAPETKKPIPLADEKIKLPTVTNSDQPDLAISLLQIGQLVGGTVVTNQNRFSAADTVGLRFQIMNKGLTATGPWSFTATLPSLSTPVYNSAPQISLKPGDSILFTLGFSNLTNQNPGLITIKADPANTVNENNESNNILTYYLYRY